MEKSYHNIKALLQCYLIVQPIITNKEKILILPIKIQIRNQSLPINKKCQKWNSNLNYLKINKISIITINSKIKMIKKILVCIFKISKNMEKIKKKIITLKI